MGLGVQGEVEEDKMQLFGDHMLGKCKAANIGLSEFGGVDPCISLLSVLMVSGYKVGVEQLVKTTLHGIEATHSPTHE